MSFRLYSVGSHTYRIGRRTVERWDNLTTSWLWVDGCTSRRDGRRRAALDSYRRKVNP